MKPWVDIQIRFVLDVHLGKLAFHLRMLGFDTKYRNDYTDDDLVKISKDEVRVLLSKDRRLLQNNGIGVAYRVQATDPKDQLLEILRRFSLFDKIAPFQRCLRCNEKLEAVGKEAVIDRLPERVREQYDDFQICRSCDRIYWKGSHYMRMEEFIRKLLQQENPNKRSEE